MPTKVGPKNTLLKKTKQLIPVQSENFGLGPGIPESPEAKVPAGPHEHKLPTGYRVRSTPVLGGLHHEYWLEKEAA